MLDVQRGHIRIHVMNDCMSPVEHPLADPYTEHTHKPGCPRCAVLQKHDAALREHYASAGVGGTTTHKLAFWNRENPNTQISRDPPDNARVAIFETSWLCDKYPEDFHFC